MSTAAIRFAVVSVPNVLGDLKDNTATHEMWIRRAADSGAVAVAFPECSLTGYGGGAASAITRDAQELRQLAACASAIGIYAFVGFCELHDDLCFSSCAVLGPGGVIGVVRKINCIPEEIAFSSGGVHFPVYRIAGRNIGVAICADASTYEVPKILAMRGAEIVFCPHANAHPAFAGDPERWRNWRLKRWQRFAADWGVYMLASNLTESGSAPPVVEGERRFCGGLAAMDPHGAAITVVDAPSAGEPMAVFELPTVENPAAELFASFRPDVIYSPGEWVFGQPARVPAVAEKAANHTAGSCASLTQGTEPDPDCYSPAFYCAAAKAYHDLSSIGRYPLPPVSLQYASVKHGSADPMPSIALRKTYATSLSQISLYDALERRRSQRRFAAVPLCLERLGTLLWAMQGVQCASALDKDYRTTPSAGGQFAVTAFVLAENIADLAPAVYVYRPQEHSLEPVNAAGKFPTWFQADDIDYGGAAAAIILVAHLDRIAARYGERGYRYGLIEAGHAAQNLMLATANLEVSCVAAGGYDDRKVSSDLGLGPLQLPVHCLILGRE